MHCRAGTASTMGTSLSLLQLTGIPSSIYNTTHDLWDLFGIRLHITMQHAVRPVAFVETEPLKTLPILTLYSFEAYSRRKNPHKDLPIEKSGSMFLSCWNKCLLFLVLYAGKEINLIHICLLLKPYTYLEGFIAFLFKPCNSPGKL